MKSTKLLAILFLVFISSSIFAQRVHYKDSYYTIVKSKIFHRGHDVFGRLTVGEKDTIHLIAKELYDERGKLKAQYKTKKKRDRYKLPADFWERKEGVIAKTVTTENDSNNIIAEIKTTEEKQLETTKQNAEKAVVNQTIETEKAQKVTAIEGKKNENNIEDNALDKTEEANEVKEKPLKNTSKKEIKKDNIQSKDANKSDVDQKEKQKRVEQEGKQQKAQKEQQKNNLLAKEKDKTERDSNEKEERPKGEKRNDKKSTQKIENKQSKEAKNIERKKKSLEKTENTQLKKQKILDIKTAALISASAVTSAVSDKETFGTIYIKINKEKTYTDKNGAILLFFDVINNSNKDLVILKPNNHMDNRLDFFSNTMECEDIPITSTDYITKDIKIKDEDYLTVPANAKIELFINGKNRSWLSCNSDDIILQMRYNPFRTTEQSVELNSNMKKELSKSLKKISPIKIESENIKFKLNKQE